MHPWSFKLLKECVCSYVTDDWLSHLACLPSTAIVALSEFNKVLFEKVRTRFTDLSLGLYQYSTVLKLQTIIDWKMSLCCKRKSMFLYFCIVIYMISQKTVLMQIWSYSVMSVWWLCIILSLWFWLIRQAEFVVLWLGDQWTEVSLGQKISFYRYHDFIRYNQLHQDVFCWPRYT